MERRKQILFFCIFFTFMFSGAVVHHYVEQKKRETFISELQIVPLSHHNEMNRERFGSREYVKIKSLAN